MYLLWAQKYLLGTIEHLQQLEKVANFPFHFSGAVEGDLKITSESNAFVFPHLVKIHRAT